MGYLSQLNGISTVKHSFVVTSFIIIQIMFSDAGVKKKKN